MNKSYSKIRHIQESNRILESRVIFDLNGHNQNFLNEQNDVLKKEERLTKFNELIKKGDADLNNTYKYRLTYPQGVDSVLDMEFTAEDFKTPFSKGTNLLTYQEEITQSLTSVIEVYNQAKSLYTDPKVANKPKFVGTPEEVKNNLSIVDQKINTATNYLTKYNNLIPKLKEVQGQSNKAQSEAADKPFIDAGLQKVSEINLADGTYNTSSNKSFIPNGPNSIWDLYIVDANGKWTGYIFRPTSGSMSRSGETPPLEINGKQVTTRPGVIWYKSSQSTNETYYRLNKKINLLESKLESLNRRIIRF